jgi:hypothetical protein
MRSRSVVGDDFPFYDIDLLCIEGYRNIRVRAGRPHTERIVPPAGEDFAFEVQRWGHEVLVCVSPTGRSVRVWLDGVEMKFPKGEK